MNNEIKEIIEHIKNYPEKLYCLNENEKHLLLDYITNLQQENERLKQPQIFIDTQDMEERYGEELYKDYLEKQVKDYKSRIEKAVEYIKSHQKVFALGVNEEVDEFDYISTSPQVLLNILNGRSDE